MAADSSAPMAEHPTHSWEAMQGGQVFYRKQQVYAIPAKLPPLADYVLAGCRNGGPLGAHARVSCALCGCAEGVPALMRDNTRLIAVGRATPIFAKSQIQVFSLAGVGEILFTVRGSPSSALRT
jgi:hypothetical protein